MEFLSGSSDILSDMIIVQGTRDIEMIYHFIFRVDFFCLVGMVLCDFR